MEVQSATGDPPQPRARVTYLKPRRSRVVIVSKPNPHPPLASPPALPEFLTSASPAIALSGNAIQRFETFRSVGTATVPEGTT